MSYRFRPFPASPLLASIALLGAFAAAGCDKAKTPGNSLDAMDSELVNGAITDEAAARKALASAITVDPHRTGRHPQAATTGTAQPGDRAATVSLASMAERQARHQPAMPAVTEDGAGGLGGNPCTDGIAYSNAWAAKLPADLPVHPAGTLQEAAGHDGACSIRVASFTVPGDRAAVIAWYETKAKASGYSARRGTDSSGDATLEGDKGDTSYIIMAGTPSGGATPVDYVWTKTD